MITINLIILGLIFMLGVCAAGAHQYNMATGIVIITALLAANMDWQRGPNVIQVLDAVIETSESDADRPYDFVPSSRRAGDAE